jgi:hypothetical protein
MTKATQAISSLIELLTEIVSPSGIDDMSKVMAIERASQRAFRIAEIYGD